MEPAAAKLIGAGLACIALAGAGIGIGTIFGAYLQGALRNPSAAAGQFTNLLIGFALAEFTGLLGFVMGMLLLFVF
ncbi:MAG: F0F1 ATP synthase subunit C [Robiginitomaculum sp.]|jgi:F-type H+-transporting ATPase subunit c|nr:F0F1 ATP synthase subunit C [Robiginitomaculum sp.]MDQ7077152.1 F0F1 ATP synthase subunit C [Robiginitomaculum sp.]